MSLGSWLKRPARETTPARTKDRPHRPRRCPRVLELEHLEDRTAPAQLRVDFLTFMDPWGNSIDVPTAGTVADARVQWSGFDMPFGAKFAVEFTYDGQTVGDIDLVEVTSIDDDLTQSTFLKDVWMRAGPHTLTVELIPISGFVDTSLADNTASLSFTAPTFQSGFNGETKFVSPIPGTPLVNWYINNYVDLNPAAGEYAIMDPEEGGETYDGHDGLDISVGGWEAMDIGVPIFAAASGVVTDRADGFYDRNDEKCGGACEGGTKGNFVEITHGNGWVTRYMHMRTNSVAVEIGDVVKAGEAIGLVGSSGNSSGPHLHFEAYHNGIAVETYLAPSAYWFNPASYTDEDLDVFPSSSRTHFITENGDNVTIFTGLDAHIKTSNGTAKSGSDYTAVDSGARGFAPIPILNDSNHEQQEQFTAKIESGFPFEQTWTATVKIIDDDRLLYYNAGTDELAINVSTDKVHDVVTIDVIGSNLRAVINGQEWLFPLDSASFPVDSIFVGSGEGNDTVTIKETPAGIPLAVHGWTGNDTINVYTTAMGGTVLIDCDDGNDTVNIGNPDELFNNSFSLDGLLADVSVFGGFNNDKLNVKDNYLVGDGYEYTITANSVQREGLGKIGYTSAIDGVTLSTGGADDTVRVTGTASNAPVSINTGGGNDTVAVGKPVGFLNLLLDSIQGKVTVNAGPGDDGLVVLDSASVAAHTYGLSDTTVSRSGAASVVYSGVEDLYVGAGSGDDEITVTHTVADTTVSAGPGDDLVRVGRNLGFNLHDMDLIQGALTVYAGEGTSDALLLRDTGEATGHTYSVDEDTVKRSGAALITYDGVEALGVMAGGSDDTFAVFGTLATTATTLYGRGGDDTFTVGTFNKLFHIPLDAVLGPLTVDGGDGSDDGLILNDRAASAGKEYLLTNTHVTWDGGTTIVYSSLGGLTLNATDHPDEVTVEGTAAYVTVNADGGGDAIHVTPVSKNLENAYGLSVDAGDGADVVTLNDQNNPYTALLLSQLYTVTGSSVGRWFQVGFIGPFFFAVSYDAVETLNLYAGGGPDFIQVRGTSASTRVIGGTGDDVVAVGSAANTLDDLLGDLIVNGGVHTAGDKLVVNDQGAAAAKTYTVNNTSVGRTGAADISFGAIEGLTLNAGGGNDTVNVNSTAAATPVLVNAGGGNDHIEVNTPVGLDGIQGALTVDGQGHLPDTIGDGLELRDDPNASGHTYTVTENGVGRDGIAPITYVGVEHMGISASAHDDVFHVQGTPASPFFVGVDGNDGDDVYNVGSAANSLDAASRVAVHDSDGGYDQLFLNDQGFGAATSYFITENEVNRLSPYLTIQYGVTYPLERVVLNGGSGGNQVTVHGLKAGTAFELNAGAGDDSVAVLPGAAAGSLTLDGQGGVNTLDYSAYATDVVVNLTLGTATDVAGGVANVANVTGGGGHDILVGAAGKNVLAGGGGRDVLIGGAGADWLDGGADDDLLFDGTTAYDGDPAALTAVRAVWADPLLSYADRVKELRKDYFKGNAVTSDGDADQLAGLGGLDWFWANLAFDLPTDRDPLTEDLN